MQKPSLVETELALVAAAFESSTLMTVECWAATALVAVVADLLADLLAEEEAQGQATRQPGKAVERAEMEKRPNQVHAVQVCLAVDQLAPVV